MKKLLIIILLFMFISLGAFADSKDKNIDENDYLKIEKFSKPLKSRLSNVYDGYEYMIKNIYDKPVLIKRIDIWYNASGKVA